MALLPALLLSAAPHAAGAFPLVPSSDEVTIGREPGQLFPDLELPTVDGTRTVRLSQMRGRRILLIEFASW